jgi:squalene-associated FAD-dependent desaturase
MTGAGGAVRATRPSEATAGGAGAVRRVIVVGGGLAGMAASVALEAAGVSVTLLEARGSLGGRAGSFADPRTGEELDNCQHVLLGCCTNLRDFYRRIGVSHLIRTEPSINFMDARARLYRLRALPMLPAPLHLGPSMMRFGALSIGERVHVTRAMLAMMRLGREGFAALADVPFGQWLDEHRQPASLLAKFYEPILTGALNEEPRRASAAYAVKVFFDSLLANAAGYPIGLPVCSLSQLYAKLPCRDVRLGARVSEVVFEAGGGRVSGVTLHSGEVLRADAVVLATNHHSVQRWVPAALAARDARFAHLERLESVPILGAHLWFDRPVLRHSHAALTTGPLQWVFRKDGEGRVVHGVISAARAWVGRSHEECLRLFEDQIRALFPAAKDAKLVRGVVVVEKRATFAPVPGADCLRPAQAAPLGGIENLYLAGDYTRTGWPATMEGAVRSGYLAADAIMSRAGFGPSARPFLVPDLAPQWAARLLRRGR